MAFSTTRNFKTFDETATMASGNNHRISKAQEKSQDTKPSQPPRLAVPSNTTLAIPGQDSYFTFQPHAPSAGTHNAKDNNAVSPLSPASPYSPVSPSLFPLPPTSTGATPDPNARAPSPCTWYSPSTPSSPSPVSPVPATFPQLPSEAHLADRAGSRAGAGASIDVPKFATGPLARSPSGDSTFRLDPSRAESRRSPSYRSSRSLLHSPSPFFEPRFSLGPYSPSTPATYPGLGIADVNGTIRSPSPARTSFVADAKTPVARGLGNGSRSTLLTTSRGGGGGGGGAGYGGKLDNVDEEAAETMSMARYRIAKRRRQILIFCSISLTGLTVVVAVVVGVWVAMGKSNST
ncbi:hypothetical protein F4779DRAFT_125053 [Xylariaceae sp. FL0662B]|nr:hypothetical protein F4779DRAFT_125053 [Xylariaceae sp. FL0662B]